MTFLATTKADCIFSIAVLLSNQEKVARSLPLRKIALHRAEGPEPTCDTKVVCK